MSPKSSRRPKASIVIRTFNEQEHLGNLLEAISQQSFQDYEIVLVDSGSTDNTLQIASNFPVHLETIAQEDFTFGRSLNRGIEAAKGQFTVIASAHVLPKNNDWLSALLAPFEDQQVALTYGKQRGGKGSKFSEDQHWRHWFLEESDWDQVGNFCNNANSAIRRDLWKRDPFDEDLTGLEDIAWASWAKAEGYKLAYVAEAEVAHIHNESPAQVINRHRREAIALQRILPESRFSLMNAIGLFLRKSLSDLRAAARLGLLRREWTSILAFRRRQYWGTYLGYQQSDSLSEANIRAFYFPPTALEPQSASKKSDALPNLTNEQ